MQPLPRSTQAGRGQLSGPAGTPRQTRSITAHITEVQPGVIQFALDFGWKSSLARTPGQLAQVLASAFVEAQIANYAKFRNGPYDDGTAPDGLAVKREYPIRRGRRIDVHDPRLWKKDADGKWISPGSGRRYNPDAQVVQRVKAQLARMWTPEPKSDGDGT